MAPTLAGNLMVEPKVAACLVHRELTTLFLLGILLGGSLAIAIVRSDLSSLSYYVAFLSLFHGLEYLITKTFQPSRANYDCISI